MAETRTCGHEHCDCEVPRDEQYCSDQCVQAAASGSHDGCACGHDRCG